MSISSTEEIVAELRAGRMVILVDEEDRENEGDLVLAAEHVTPEAINFMIKHARGLVCLTLTEEHCNQLDLTMMTAKNGTSFGTNFTVSIEAAEGVTTGISAADRAKTIQVAVAKGAKPSDIVQPGHIFPLRAVPGGVLMRAGHTEAGCDLTAMAGLMPASVICEIIKDDGTMARLPELLEFAQEHGLKIGTIADLIHYRSQNECMVERIGERPLRTAHGDFRMIAFRDKSKAVRDYLVKRPEIRTEKLPAYAPEMNPDELVCAWTKYGRLGNLAAANADWLRDYIITELVYPKKHPEILNSFIEKPGYSLRL